MNNLLWKINPFMLHCSFSCSISSQSQKNETTMKYNFINKWSPKGKQYRTKIILIFFLLVSKVLPDTYSKLCKALFQNGDFHSSPIFFIFIIYYYSSNGVSHILPTFIFVSKNFDVMTKLRIWNFVKSVWLLWKNHKYSRELREIISSLNERQLKLPHWAYERIKGISMSIIELNFSTSVR